MSIRRRISQPDENAGLFLTLFQTNNISDSIEKLNQFLTHNIVIIIYRDPYLDKLQKIDLYSGFVLTIFSEMTVSVVNRIFYSKNMISTSWCIKILAYQHVKLQQIGGAP